MTAAGLRKSRRRPNQAVILAGGRGTRLQPITHTRPKAMVEFHGKPFLEYIIELLREQGFERVLLLLGHLPSVIQDYFGDGDRVGVEISYSITEPDDLTSHRLKVARELLDPQFLLMYCDNYWPMRMDRMWQQFQESDAKAQVTVYSNKDGYSRDSVIVDEEGRVTVFDRSRTHPDLSGVEIGYAIIDESVLDLLPDHDMLFEEAIYPQLVARGELAAYVTDHRYYSVGSHERLPLTEEFFRRHPTVILDRDGVLNVKPPRAQYVRTWDEFKWLPDAREALRRLREANFRVIIVSNQAGIGRGEMSELALLDIHERMKSETLKAGGRIDAIYYCPHDWDDGCDCRKPRPGMLFAAQRDFHLDLSRTLFIGDDERDAEAADAAGCRAALVSESRSLLDVVRTTLREELVEVNA